MIKKKLAKLALRNKNNQYGQKIAILLKKFAESETIYTFTDVPVKNYVMMYRLIEGEFSHPSYANTHIVKDDQAHTIEIHFFWKDTKMVDYGEKLVEKRLKEFNNLYGGKLVID